MGSKKNNFYEKWRTDKKYIKAIMQLPCISCGNHWQDICAHHKTGGGIGTKSPDWESIPLCSYCHQDIHNQNNYNLYKKQDSLIILAREKLIKRGLIKEGEYPKEKDYI